MKRHVLLAVTGVIALGGVAYLSVSRHDEPSTVSGNVPVVTGADAGAIVVRHADRPSNAAAVPVGVRTTGSLDARGLYALTRSEARDQAWAPSREAALQDMFRRAAPIGPTAPLNVTCATTVCEVSGTASAGAEPDAINRGWDALRLLAKDDVVGRQGLVASATEFGSGRSLHAFTIYYRRAG